MVNDCIENLFDIPNLIYVLDPERQAPVNKDLVGLPYTDNDVVLWYQEA